eukprot:m.55473 g.55473  ORF g.55473 m.55473 type:complete len:70 (+) comp10987_c0_seq2:1981-2190(+)
MMLMTLTLKNNLPLPCLNRLIQIHIMYHYLVVINFGTQERILNHSNSKFHLLSLSFQSSQCLFDFDQWA